MRGDLFKRNVPAFAEIEKEFVLGNFVVKRLEQSFKQVDPDQNSRVA